MKNKKNIIFAALLVLLGLIALLALLNRDSIQSVGENIFSLDTYIGSGAIKNPLRVGSDGTLLTYYDFVLNEETDASENVLDCFGTTLADLEAEIAWTSNTSSEGVFCNLVYTISDTNELPVKVIKEYSIPGEFQIIKTPFITGLFGDVILETGATYSFDRKVEFSNQDVVLGGSVASRLSVAEDQFGILASEKIVSVTVGNTNMEFAKDDITYDSCISFISDYSSISLPYAVYEHIWCPIEKNKYSLVARELAK
jgi:hypothetical protein